MNRISVPIFARYLMIQYSQSLSSYPRS
ncbi:hypothetical protein FIM09_03965 [SAR202 cluster bacterium AC-647-P02_OGT_505m]|nr:hypothetical protein [SAR202 cluster bacterium AC-647-P02_OGT_505m]